MKNLKIIYNDIIKGFTEVQSKHFGKFYYKHLTVEDSAYIEDTSILHTEKATQIGLPTEKEQIKTLNEQGIWTDSEELELHNLEIFLNGLKDSRRKVFLQKDINVLDNQIEESQVKLDELENLKEESKGLTVEKYAAKKSSEYYLRSVLFEDQEFKKRVLTEEKFEQLSELDLNKYYEDYIEISKMFSERTVKKIALSPFFLSIFYICSDDPMTLFGKPVIKLTYNQTNLFTYARYYKNIITEAKVKPPPELYAEPDKLVDWLESAKEGQKVLEKAMPEEGKAGGTSIVGATKEDLERMGVTSDSSNTINLSKEAAKKGGTLNMEDFVRLHG